MNWDKVDIVNYLTQLRGYRTYLEICTPTTGNQFAKIDRSRFDVCHRLMCCCPDDYADGLNIDFRSQSLNVGQCFAEIRRNDFSYDIVLVDPWHEYKSSLRDMQLALSLLNDSGSIVIHDCNPPTADTISPQFIPGSWCGLTFIAYIDFVAQNRGINYRTVDTDFGCGIVQKTGNPSEVSHHFGFRNLWNSVKNDPIAAFQFVQEYKYTLLNLVQVNEFIRTEAEAMLAGSTPAPLLHRAPPRLASLERIPA